MTTLLINGIDISQLVSSPFKIFVYNVLNVEYTRKNLNNLIVDYPNSKYPLLDSDVELVLKTNTGFINYSISNIGFHPFPSESILKSFKLKFLLSKL